MNLHLLVAAGLMFLCHHLVDGATTRVTCRPNSESSMCLGHQLDIICEINGTIKTGITWSQPANEANNLTPREVFICKTPESGAHSSTCFDNNLPGYTIVENTLNRQVLRIDNFTEKDLGKWSCRDGDISTKQLCEVSKILVAPQLPELLEASCSKFEDENKFNASCTRVDEWGTPAVELILSIQDKRQILNTSDGNFSIIKEGIGSLRVTCSLDGPSSVCLKNIDSVECPSVASATGVIIGIILGVVVVIVVIVFVGVWWFRKSNHNEEEDIITPPEDRKKPEDERRDLMSDSKGREEP